MNAHHFGLNKIQKIVFVTTAVLLFLSVIFFSSLNVLFAQTVNNGCKVDFKRNLSLGSYGEDVRQLQIFLKSQNLVLVTGRESTVFGFALQKMLASYKVVTFGNGNADGSLDSKTRNHINAICAKLRTTPVNNASNNQGNTNTNATSTDLVVFLSGEAEFVEGDQARVTITTSLPVETFSATSLIIDGGTVASLRKISKTEYLLIINPTENAKKIYVQVEADGLNSGKIKNSRASNEMVLTRIIETQVLTDGSTPTATTTATVSDFVNIAAMIEYMKSIHPKPTAKHFCSTEPFFTLARTVVPVTGLDYKYCKPSTFDDESGYPSALQNVANSASDILGARFLNTGESFFTAAIDGYTQATTTTQSGERIPILKFLGYLPYVPQTYPNGLPVKFDRAIINQAAYSCTNIYTYHDNKVYELFEGGEKYDFRAKENKDGTFKLLAYPKSAYAYWSKGCFVEEELEPRYFPNGLFCCSGEVCNKKENLQSINYTAANGQTYQVKQIYSTDLSDVYVKNGVPVDTNNPNFRIFGLGTTRNECGGYNRPPASILKQIKGSLDSVQVDTLINAPGNGNL